MNKKEEFDKNDIESYQKTKFFAKIPSWLKILFLKYWAAGAAFYFFGVGGGFLWSSVNTDDSTLFLLVCLILGYALVSEYVVKQIVRLMRTSRDDTYYYNIINVKGTKSFFMYLGYSVLVIVPCFYILGFLSSKGLISVWGVEGVEPLGFGLAVTVVDFIYLFIKNTIFNAYKKYKFNKSNKVEKDAEL